MSMTDLVDVRSWEYDVSATPDSSFVRKVYANTDTNELVWVLADHGDIGYRYDLGTLDDAGRIVLDAGHSATPGRYPHNFTR